MEHTQEQTRLLQVHTKLLRELLAKTEVSQPLCPPTPPPPPPPPGLACLAALPCRVLRSILAKSRMHPCDFAGLNVARCLKFSHMYCKNYCGRLGAGVRSLCLNPVWNICGAFFSGCSVCAHLQERPAAGPGGAFHNYGPLRRWSWWWTGARGFKCVLIACCVMFLAQHPAGSNRGLNTF